MPLFNAPTMFYDPLLIQSGSVDVANVAALNIVDNRIVLSQSGPYVVDVSLNLTGSTPGTISAVGFANNNQAISTTSPNFQTRLALTASNLTSGSYILSWNIQAETSQANRDIELNIADQSGSISVFQTRFLQPNQSVPFSGMRIINIPSITTKYYSLQYKRVTATTLTVASASMALWKIS